MLRLRHDRGSGTDGGDEFATLHDDLLSNRALWRLE
jgi:hypothetical protein